MCDVPLGLRDLGLPAEVGLDDVFLSSNLFFHSGISSSVVVEGLAVLTLTDGWLLTTLALTDGWLLTGDWFNRTEVTEEGLPNTGRAGLPTIVAPPACSLRGFKQFLQTPGLKEWGTYAAHT